LAENFSNLTQSGRIGSLELKNRMTVAAMGVNLAEEDGSCGDRILAYHERQAQGGAGLIVMGATGIAWPAGAVQPWQVAISEDRHIPGLRAVADACHKYGAKIAAQIHHGGLVAAQGLNDRAVLMPSIPPKGRSDLGDYMLMEEMMSMYNPDAPKQEMHVMTLEDIEHLASQYAAAAVRAVEAGLDGVEIHAGHGYIISEFLSPAMNQREDEYGGSLENRARILLQVIAAVREKVGRDYPVWVKLDSEEFGREQGITLEDAKVTARMVEKAGADAIAVSAYHDPNRGATHADSNIPHPVEQLVNNAIAIRQSVTIPVISAGRIEPESGDKHIGKGHFDFLSMGRKLLADPDLPNKLAAGQRDQVRPCIYCYCCVSQIYVRNGVKCAVNPETARERERTIVPSDNPRHIGVIGGGPGGMEAARRLSLRGHRVTLLEASNRLGGTLQFASIPYEPNQRLLKWLRQQVAQSSVDVHLNTLATPEVLKNLGLEEVVVATGANRSMPEIPGNDRDFVFSGDEMRALMLGEDHPELVRKTNAFTRTVVGLGSMTGATAIPEVVRLASHIWMPLGKKVVIVGGELVGLELAEYLAERGRDVTVLEESNRPGKGLFLVRRMRLLDELKHHLGVSLNLEASSIRIEDHKVVYKNGSGQERTVAADHVIVAMGASGDTTLSDQLSSADFTVHSIGDCTGVGYIEGAMEAAAELAATL
jgi:2,4-dienoyl-CoA reductase-like NADH-dependent reductase (Old Yellow Enzyme family)/thioredoxin reductase